MRAKLTVRAIEAAKPHAAPYELRDTELKGLLLRVQPSGVKAFYVELQRGVREALGKHPVLTLEAARVRALSRLADFAITGRRKSAKPRSRTLNDYIADDYGPWVTANRKSGTATVARLKAAFKASLGIALSDITAFQVERWRSQRIASGVAAATINRDLTALKAALQKAVEWQLLDTHPLAAVKPSKVDDHGRLRYLSAAEELRLREALAGRDSKIREERERGNAWRSARGHDLLPSIPANGYGDHLTPMTLLALNTGMRRGELTSLVADDIDFERRMITVRGSVAKSGMTRHIPMNAEASAVLEAYLAQHQGSGRLFALERLNKGFTAVLTQAKIYAFRFHDCRHTFASNLVMAGVDLNTVRELLGHADLKMTLRYAHLAPEHKAAAVALLGKLQ